MAANRRGKTQARRSGGNSNSNSLLPGWAWMVIGVALTLVLVLLAPRLFKHEGDGFFRPTPNPDAQPRPVSDETVVDDEAVADSDGAASKPAAAAEKDAKPRNFDFYTLLPGKETPLSDAELASREKAEKQAVRDTPSKPADPDAAKPPVESPPPPSAGAPVSDREPAPQNADTAAATRPLPKPVEDVARAQPPASAPRTNDPATAGTPASTSRYLLQAGAFGGAGQADELKAKIALLGLGARVESAKINGKTVYRVRMGPYASASELAEAKRKLASGGLPGMAIKVN